MKNEVSFQQLRTPAAAPAINRVSALLTPDELRSLNQRSTGEKLSSTTIATDWLTSKKLL